MRNNKDVGGTNKRHLHRADRVCLDHFTKDVLNGLGEPRSVKATTLELGDSISFVQLHNDADEEVSQRSKHHANRA
jgi:hypothetical protein